MCSFLSGVSLEVLGLSLLQHMVPLNAYFWDTTQWFVLVPHLTRRSGIYCGLGICHILGYLKKGTTGTNGDTLQVQRPQS